MTAEEERMQEYLRSREKKDKSSTKKASPTPETVEPPTAKTPLTFYYRDLIIYLLVALLVSVMATFFIGIVVSSFIVIRDDQVIYVFLLCLIIFAIPATLKIRQASAYISFVNGALYPVQGWNEFVVQRSDNFWKGSWYTRISVAIRLVPHATPMHREVAAAFMKELADSAWAIPYSKIAWQAGFTPPMDFTTDDLSVTGDIGRGKLYVLIEKLCFTMPKLSGLLGDALQTVEIKSEKRERECKKINVRRNASDRS